MPVPHYIYNPRPQTIQNITLAQSDASLDAFARQRFSLPYTIFDTKPLTSTSQTLFFDDLQASGGGTAINYLPNNAANRFSVTASTAGRRIRQSRMRFNYQPGLSQFVALTFNFDGIDSGVSKRIGYFDDQNGLFLENNGTNVAVVKRSFTTGSAVDTRVVQADWNLDKLDGSGESGITIDWTKSQIFIVDFEWLGVGRVRYGFFLNGKPVYVHEITNLNTLDTVYMSTPNLPIRYEIENDGTGEASTFTVICGTVVSEGAQRPVGSTRSISRGGTEIENLDTGNIYPLISFRLKPTHLGVTVAFIEYQALATSVSDAFETIIYFNPTFNGTDQVSWVNVDNSALQYDVSRDITNTISGGTILYSRYTPDPGGGTQGLGLVQPESLLKLGSSIDGTPDEIVIAMRPLVDNIDALAGASWREQA